MSYVLSPSPYLGAPSATAGQSQGNGEAMETKGAGQTPEVSTVTTSALSTTTDQDPAQAPSPDPHLSKSEVSRLADQGVALGFGVKQLTYLEELGFLRTHSGAESGWGRSCDLCACSAPLAVTRLRSSKHTSSNGGMKED